MWNNEKVTKQRRFKVKFIIMSASRAKLVSFRVSRLTRLAKQEEETKFSSSEVSQK